MVSSMNAGTEDDDDVIRIEGLIVLIDYVNKGEECVYEVVVDQIGLQLIENA